MAAATITETETVDNNNNEKEKEWIRGVNVGGWLLAERFISPYLFAVNSCHLQGSLCWYPGQIGSDGNKNDGSNFNAGGHDYGFCDPAACKPVLSVRAMPPVDYHLIRGIDPDVPNNKGITADGLDYPVDEYTLGALLRSSPGGIETATKYMERHWDTFVTYEDLKTLKENGVTHLRIPMGYWIRNTPGMSLLNDEPFVPGGWKYFVRACLWSRQLGLQVWADLHGAPGSENGFDNSGHYLGKSSCDGWANSPKNVQRTLEILTDIVSGVKEEQLEDVVTGFGVMNEPFADCNKHVLRQYYEDSLRVVRDILGPETAVFVGDSFRAYRFNDGKFWLNSTKYNNTYLDSHPYHVFFEQGRSFTPKQHIAYVCRHDSSSVKDCCYDDPDTKLLPSKGIARLTGEWSGAYDVLPTAMTPHIMKGILHNGTAPLLRRQLTQPQKDFLNHFVRAQMIAYEANDTPGLAAGWLFWNFKMEGGAFIEWDFLRGLKEGWMPPIPEPNVASEDVYGTCLDIYNRTKDYSYYDIVNEYPDPRTLDWNQWQGWDANDDFVMSDPNIPTVEHRPFRVWYDPRRLFDQPWFVPLLIGVIVVGVWKKLTVGEQQKRRERLGYTEIKV